MTTRLCSSERCLNVDTLSDIFFVAEDLFVIAELVLLLSERQGYLLTLRISSVPNTLRKMTESNALMEPIPRRWSR